eukprot:7073586-Lingulodinium_polyedra.AAC.1
MHCAPCAPPKFFCRACCVYATGKHVAGPGHRAMMAAGVRPPPPPPPAAAPASVPAGKGVPTAAPPG